MALNLNALSTELQAAIAVQWADVVQGGNRYVYELEQLKADQLENIPLPFAVLVIPEAQESDWNGDGDTFSLDVEIWYVGTTAGTAAAVRTKVETMLSYLEGATLTNGYVEKVLRAGASCRQAINGLLTEKKLQVLSGGVVARILVAE
jgi:hypothetical protein